eukprot:PhM_4_TR3087/c1_g1_i6/m.53867
MDEKLHERHGVEGLWLCQVDVVRHLAREKLVRKHTHTPNVARRRGVAARLLRRHVQRRAVDPLGGRRVLAAVRGRRGGAEAVLVAGQPGDACARTEVRQLALPVDHQQHVVRLHVAVHDAVRVQERQAAHNVAHVALRRRQGDGAELAQQRVQRPAGDVLHHDDELAAHDAAAEVAHDVVVAQLAEQLHLLEDVVHLAPEGGVGVLRGLVRTPTSHATSWLLCLLPDLVQIHTLHGDEGAVLAHPRVDGSSRTCADVAVRPLPRTALLVDEHALVFNKCSTRSGNGNVVGRRVPNTVTIRISVERVRRGRRGQLLPDTDAR